MIVSQSIDSEYVWEFAVDGVQLASGAGRVPILREVGRGTSYQARKFREDSSGRSSLIVLSEQCTHDAYYRLKAGTVVAG